MNFEKARLLFLRNFIVIRRCFKAPYYHRRCPQIHAEAVDVMKAGTYHSSKFNHKRPQNYFVIDPLLVFTRYDILNRSTEDNSWYLCPRLTVLLRLSSLS